MGRDRPAREGQRPQGQAIIHQARQRNEKHTPGQETICRPRGIGVLQAPESPYLDANLSGHWPIQNLQPLSAPGVLEEGQKAPEPEHKCSDMNKM